MVRSSILLSQLDNIIEIPVDAGSDGVGGLPVGKTFCELHDGHQSQSPGRHRWLTATGEQVGEVLVLDDSAKLIAHSHIDCAFRKGGFGDANFLVEQQTWLRLAGGAFLCYLGLKTLLARPAPSSVRNERKGGGLLGAYASTLFLTLTNPMTILSFAAIFAGAGVGTGAEAGVSSVTLLVVGVFLGSALWWLLLSTGAGSFRGKVGTRGMRVVNIASGTVILAFGLAAVWSRVSS